MSTPFIPHRPAGALLEAPPAPAATATATATATDHGRGPAGEARHLPELGPLAPFAADPAVTDLLLDARGALWRDAGHGLERVAEQAPVAPDEARRLAVGLVAAGGRHLDDAAPCADVRVASGVRVHAVLPPVSTGGALVSVRIGRAAPWRLAELRRSGTVDDRQAAVLVEAVLARRNVLVCGAAGSGKTSLLAALLAEAPPDERIVTIEDVAELAIDHPHVVGLEARQPNGDGAGGVALAALVRESLRMRPDRIVVGECRGAEVAELLTALNTGHDGGAGTVHCAGPSALGARLEALGALAGLDAAALRAQALAAIDLVVQLERREGRRRVTRIGALGAGPGGALVVVDP